MSKEHEEMLARVRVSDRVWCEADLYFRTNRWAEDGRSQDVSECFWQSARWSWLKTAVTAMKPGEIRVNAYGDLGRSTYQRTGR